MNHNDFQELEKFCCMTVEQAMSWFNTYLKTKYKKVVYHCNYIVATGEVPIALVAHVDTVFAFPPEQIFYDRTKQVCLASGMGAGFDDRVGLYAIWKIVETAEKLPTIIITNGEENLCVGARALGEVSSYTGKYLIELDRSGGKDCVFYQCVNKDFKKYIESFGFKEALGSYTDISFLMNDWSICGVNLSVGYYMEHTDYEYLKVRQLENTISKVQRMLQDKNIPDFKYERM